MRVSVVICTRNRAASLDRTLGSLAAMGAPAGTPWELVIVDNGGTDATPEVVAGHVGALPVRRVFEPEPGLSNARNRGVAEARGDYIVWTDDDVIVQPGWLSAYLHAFETFPEAAVFGGKVTPSLEAPTPDWFSQNRDLLAFLIAERDFGAEPVTLDAAEHRLPFGANFAIRGAEQRAHRYDPDLGVGPGRNRSGEETAVIRAILAEGARGVWIPDAEVLHLIPAARQTEAYVVDYYRGIGATWAHLHGRAGENFMGPNLAQDRPRVLGAPALAWRKQWEHRLKYLALRPTAPPRRWLWHLTQYGFYRGAVEQWRLQAGLA
ncbi:MAG: glycosyltransferase family 2 protein [Phenylobacterium sp.]|uniref:glycosyltransferase family 2 protein n=1 Tax=Phenylobacterium sp. TaxID=1871053 RepID=UPI00391B3AFD